MDAFLAMQLESIMVFSIVIAAFLLRAVLVQLATCLHRKALYEQRIELLLSSQAAYFGPRAPIAEPMIISPASLAFDYNSTGYSLA